MNASDYHSVLLPTTIGHLRECCVAFDEKQFFASAVWGAVFLEAFLADLARELGIRRSGRDDLNGRIQQLAQFQKNPSPEKLRIPDEVVKRCEDIRNTRNRLVHDCELAKSTIAHDAQFLISGLEVILNWYRNAKGPAPPALPEGPPVPETGIPVFLSAVTPHNQRQQYFLESFCSKLRGIGIRPVRNVPLIYDRSDPIGKVRRDVELCEALIVVGLERSHAYFLRDKEGSQDENEETHRRYTSGWLHLEAGIANALGKRVFVLCEQAICSDGVFDRAWNSYPVAELTTLDDGSPQLATFLVHVDEWVRGRPQAALDASRAG